MCRIQKMKSAISFANPKDEWNIICIAIDFFFLLIRWNPFIDRGQHYSFMNYSKCIAIPSFYEQIFISSCYGDQNVPLSKENRI